MRRLWIGLLVVAAVLAHPLVGMAGQRWETVASSGTAAGSRMRFYQTTVPAENGVVALSALAYDPVENAYWTVNDAGPATPDFPLHLVKLQFNPVRAKVLKIVPLKDEEGRQLTGHVLDPEDLAVAPDGTFWMGDEYGPWILHFSRDGRLLQRVDPPAKYRDRKSGRGFEGLAISANGRTVYAMLQTALEHDADKRRTWLLAYDTVTGRFNEYVYRLEDVAEQGYAAGTSPWIGTSGLAMLRDGSMLVIERDNLAGPAARVKRIYRITLPARTGGTVTKALYLDVLALGYPHEKLEGIAAQASGGIALINDNDANPANVTEIWMIHRR